jgi:hypothetical protein
MLRLRDLLAIAAALAALSFVTVGCGGDGDGETSAAAGTYVGTVDGTDAYIALVSDGKQVSGYLCDGTPKAVKVCRWLDNAEVTGQNAALGERPRRFLVEARLADEATGEVETYPQAHSFTAEAASGDAGLYRAIKGKVGEVGTVEAGWIILNDGSQRGGSERQLEGSIVADEPVPELDPGQGSVSVAQAGQLRPRKISDPLVID